MRFSSFPFLLGMLFAVHCSLCSFAQSSVSVTRLRTEQMTAPMSVDTRQPRLSYIIESAEHGVKQTAYHIQVATRPELLARNEPDLWDSGLTMSEQSLYIAYDGRPLKDNMHCYWRVRVQTTKGESPWSEVAEWGMGIMGETHWRPLWIGYDGAFPWDEETSHSRLSARYLRTEFNTEDKPIARATVHVSGVGLYELYINGERIGNQVLAPAPTDYRKTVLYNSFDVTEQLQANDANAIGVTLGNGRFYTMHQHYKPYKITNFGYPKLRLYLIIDYADGTVQRVTSNEHWRLTADGPIRSNNEYDGEVYDARRELGDWTRPHYDDSAWLQAERVSIPTGTMRGNRSPNMRVMDSLPVASMKRTDDGRYLIDFGQNLTGWVRMRLHASHEGDSIRLRYAERLTADGDSLYVDNLRSAQSTDTYVCSGREDGTQTWSARFSYHGFRYVEVSGLTDASPDDFTAEMVYDEMQTTGSFSCSSTTINAVVRNAWWGIADNYKGMPIDCPQRDERQPWLGDRTMGALGESYLFDNQCLYTKWMNDISEAQTEQGDLPDVAPAFYRYYTSGLTWPAAYPFICRMLYEQYGDPEPIARHYDSIARWLRFVDEEFRDQTTGLIKKDKYGDWCMPPESAELIHSADPNRQTDGQLIGTAYYYKILQTMAYFAELLGRDADVDAYNTLAEQTRQAFNRAFLTVKPGTSPVSTPHMLYPDSIFYGNNTATANVLPLAFGMVPGEYEEEVTKNLIATIINANNGHVSCGVIGQQWILRELTRRGRGDVAYLMAGQTAYPSYGYMIEHGATTIWELWNGDTASPKMNSGNHVMLLGDFLTWLYADLAGIAPAAPGFKRICMRPDFSIQELSHVDASYLTPYGTVKSSWVNDLRTLTWDISIPCNTEAEVYLPVVDTQALKVDGAICLRTEGNSTVYLLPSGDYHLSIDLDPSIGDMRKGIEADEFLYEATSFPECHASTVLELGNGDLLAAFFGGTKERNPDCCIWVCRKPKGEDRWSEPYLAADGVFSLSDPDAMTAGIGEETTRASVGPIAVTFRGDTATARRKACWNPVLYQVPGSEEVLLFYKIGLNVADWTGWLVRSNDGGLTWSAHEALPEGILGPVKNKPVCVDGRIISPSSTEGKGGWRVHFELSDDGGQTWRKVGPIAAELSVMTKEREADWPEHGDSIARARGDSRLKPIYAIQPSILTLPDGRLQALCRTLNGRIATTFSSDNGETWSTLQLIDEGNNNSGLDASTLKSGLHVMIYNNFQTIDGTPKGPRTPLSIATSDDGLHWTPILTLEDSPISQYSYPAIVEGRDGSLHVTYTWRRQRIKYMHIRL